MRMSDWSSDVCSSDLGFEHGSWLAAYLVLVGGVAQIALGGGQAWLADRVPRARTTRTEAWSWNRSEERRVGKEVVGTCSYRWSPCPSKQHKYSKVCIMLTIHKAINHHE